MPLSIHDYSIYHYLALQNPNQPSAYLLILYTENHEQDNNRYVDVLFYNTHTHYFVGTVVHTILFDIQHVQLESLYQDYHDLFEQTKDHQWPLPYHSLAEAAEYVRTRQLKVYRISSSYGLVDGWVIAEHMELRERAQQRELMREYKYLYKY